MKDYLIILFAALVIVGLPQQTFSRDDRLMFPISDALSTDATRNKLQGVDFYFGDQKHPEVLETLVNLIPIKKPTPSLNQTNRLPNGCFCLHCCNCRNGRET